MQMKHSPLMLAAQEGQHSVVELLIAEKANLHYQAIVSHILVYCDQLRTTIIALVKLLCTNLIHCTRSGMATQHSTWLLLEVTLIVSNFSFRRELMCA